MLLLVHIIVPLFYFIIFILILISHIISLKQTYLIFDTRVRNCSLFPFVTTINNKTNTCMGKADSFQNLKLVQSQGFA